MVNKIKIDDLEAMQEIAEKDAKKVLGGGSKIAIKNAIELNSETELVAHELTHVVQGRESGTKV